MGIKWADLTDTVRLARFGDEVCIADLREIAANWHDGQSSAMYKFASSGAVTDALAWEAWRCAEQAQSSGTDEDAPESGYPEYLMLQTIAEYAESAGHDERGPTHREG